MIRSLAELDRTRQQHLAAVHGALNDPNIDPVTLAREIAATKSALDQLLVLAEPRHAGR